MVSRGPTATKASRELQPPAWRRAGWRILIPGYPQWAWRQRERALVLFGSFLTSLSVGLFIWGTQASFLILIFAFGTHVASAADVIRQTAFPGFGRLVPAVSASAGLGLGCYGPALGLALLFAWPGYGGDSARDAYLINRGAYLSTAPEPGDQAWVQLPGWSRPRAAQVVAGPGQQVEWSASGLRVAGLGVPWSPPSSAWQPRELSFSVPEGQVLVALQETPGQPGKPATSCGLALVDIGSIGGRAWARLYPVWDRGPVR